MDEVQRYEHAVNNDYVDRRYNRVNPKRMTVRVSLKEVYLGSEKNIVISRRSMCRHCQGTGAKGGQFKTCPHCGGQGMSIKTVRTGMGIMRMQ